MSTCIGTLVDVKSMNQHLKVKSSLSDPVSINHYLSFISLSRDASGSGLMSFMVVYFTGSFIAPDRQLKSFEHTLAARQQTAAHKKQLSVKTTGLVVMEMESRSR